MIRTVVFDLGNVLLHFSHERMCARLATVAGLAPAEVKRLLIDSELQWEFERGRVSRAEVMAAFTNAAGRALDESALFHAASDIFWRNESIAPVVAALRAAGKRLLLLSNTCDPHIAFVRERFGDVLEPFDATVLSFEVGAAKPEAAIYEALLEKVECAPEECFYTDDIPAYVAAGRTHGLRAHVYNDTPSLLRHLADAGVTLPAEFSA